MFKPISSDSPTRTNWKAGATFCTFFRSIDTPVVLIHFGLIQ